jgi:hypothetical protein
MDGPNGLFPASVEELLKDRQNVSTLVGVTKEENSMMKITWPQATEANAESMCDQVAERDSPNQQNQQQLVSSACKLHYVEPNKKVFLLLFISFL